MSHTPPEGGGFRISAWAIKNPVPVAVLFIALVLAGIISYGGLPVKQFPNVQFPVVAVTITQNGAAPAEGTCIFTGKPAVERILVARAY